MQWIGILVIFGFGSTLTRAQSSISLDLSRDRVTYGDRLTVTVTVVVTEDVVRPSLEILVPNNFTFGKANIRSTICPDRNICENREQSYDGRENYVTVSKFYFDNRVLEDAKKIPLIQAESGSEWGYSVKIWIHFDSIWSSDIDHGIHYVIGILQYQKPAADGENAQEKTIGLQHFSGKYVSIFPVDIAITLDGEPPGTRNDTGALFHVIDVIADIDRRIGDSYMKLPLSTDLTILRAEYVMGKDSKAIIDLPLPKDNELSILLPVFSFTDLSDQWCLRDRCQLHLTVDVVTVPKNGGDTVPGKEIGIKATMVYGQDFQSLAESDTIFLLISPQHNGTGVGTPPSVDGNEPETTTETITVPPETDETISPKLEVGMENSSAAVDEQVQEQPENATEGSDHAMNTDTISVEPEDVENSSIAVDEQVRVQKSKPEQKESAPADTDPAINIDPINLEPEDRMENSSNAVDEQEAELEPKEKAAEDADPAINTGTISPESEDTLENTSQYTSPITAVDEQEKEQGQQENAAENTDPTMNTSTISALENEDALGNSNQYTSTTTAVDQQEKEQNQKQTAADDAGPARNNTSCRADWWTLEHQMNDRCYYFPNLKLSFNKAETYCREIGGHLPSYHSPYGLITLSSFWKNYVPATEIWLGLSKETYNQPWKWADQSAYDFQNWCDTEEQDWANCTIISNSFLDNNYCWMNRACGLEYYFVCYEPSRNKALWWW